MNAPLLSQCEETARLLKALEGNPAPAVTQAVTLLQAKLDRLQRRLARALIDGAADDPDRQ